jgi:ketosteroid isomerase-like protein
LTRAWSNQLRGGGIAKRGMDIIDPKLVLYGDAAVVTYIYRSTPVAGETESGKQSMWNATTVYFWQDGDWKVAHMHRSYLPHKLPPAVDVPIPLELAPREYGGILGELMALESAAMERWRKGDPWGFIEISAPEVTYFDTGTPHRLDGREVLRAEYAQREGKIHYDVMEFIDPRVQVCGDAAVLLYRFFSTVLQPDGSIASRMPWNCTEVFAKQAGAWQIVHTHWSLIKGKRI